jgi:hypothetical protein
MTYGKRPSDYPETNTEKGANRLRGIIWAYWRGRGYDVQLHLEKMMVTTMEDKTDGRGEAALYAVRSNMVGGMPVRRLPEINEAA